MKRGRHQDKNGFQCAAVWHIDQRIDKTEKVQGSTGRIEQILRRRSGKIFRGSHLCGFLFYAETIRKSNRMFERSQK